MSESSETRIASFKKYDIPSYMWPGLDNYLRNHIRPGHFLTAVLSNNLKEACLRADDTNRRHLFDYVNFLWNEAPVGSWGSEEAFKHWTEDFKP